MPNLPCHIDLAQKMAERLRHPVLDDNMGYVFLGSTSPDIRAITRGRREDYHFAPLDFDEIGAGVKGLFQSYPHLENASDHDGPTQGFIAGYISHLISDETWITEIYRPYFGNPSVFENEVFAKVMDRALQLDLDRQSVEVTEAAVPLIPGVGDGIAVGFIPSDTLSDWSQWVAGFLERGFSWDRLRHMARRIAAGDDDHPAHGMAEEFLRTMPESLELIYQRVPRDRVERFREQAVQNLVTTLTDYLS